MFKIKKISGYGVTYKEEAVEKVNSLKDAAVVVRKFLDEILIARSKNTFISQAERDQLANKNFRDGSIAQIMHKASMIDIPNTSTVIEFECHTVLDFYYRVRIEE